MEALQASPFVVTSSCHCGVGEYDGLVISANTNVVCVTLVRNGHIACHEIQREGNALPLYFMLFANVTSDEVPYAPLPSTGR
jgi:hypothetical protein